MWTNPRETEEYFTVIKKIINRNLDFFVQLEPRIN